MNSIKWRNQIKKVTIPWLFSSTTTSHIRILEFVAEERTDRLIQKGSPNAAVYQFIFVTGKQNFRFFSPFIRKTNISPREEGWGGRELEVFSSPLESIGVKSSRFKWVSEYKWTGMNAWMGEWTNEWANESNHWLPIYRKPNQTTKFNLSSITKCSCVLCHSWTISTHPIYGRYMMSGRKWVGRLHTSRICECYWMFAIMACAVWSADDRMSGCLLRPGYSEIKLRKQQDSEGYLKLPFFPLWNSGVAHECECPYIVHTSLKS